MKNTYTLRRVLLVGAFALVLGSCKDNFTTPDSLSGTPLASVLAGDANFNIVTAVITKTVQYPSLNNNNSGVVTMFAPSDIAFQTFLTATISPALPTPVTEKDVVNWVNEKLSTSSTPSISTLNGIINYHLISSKITSDLITGNQVFATLNGARLSISKGAAVVLNANSAVNGATVTGFDQLASNGVIHTVDRVMNVVATANVLSPLALTVSYATNPPVIGGGTSNDGVTTNFNLFAALLRVTGQVPNILPNTSPLPDFTVFQPTDAAVMAYLQSIDGSGTFATELSCYTYISSLIPPAVPPAIPNPTLAQLTDIMKYHLVAGRFLTTDFVNGQALSTSLTGSSITVGISPVPPLTGPYTYTLLDLNALVLDPTIIPTNNILTNSGILHTVSGVLRPN